MTENQKDCILEIQELLLAINEVVKKYDLESEFVACLAVGFLNMDTAYKDEFGDDRAEMSLLSSFAVEDAEELEDLLSYCTEAYQIQKEEEKSEDTSNIDYWINLARRNGDVN